MKKKYNKIGYVLFLILLNVGGSVFCQQKILPGAVKEPLFWLQPQKNGNTFYWVNKTNSEVAISNKKQQGMLFNYNPSIVFDSKQDSLLFSLGINNKRKQTFFIVYKVKDSLKEHLLWTLNDSDKIVSIATTKRLVDLKKYNYQSYWQKITARKANIHFYQQHLTDSVAKPSFLTIGLQSRFQKLPPEEFNGNISEIVLYDRMLSGIETQKVASYLAIKYGISLSQFETKNYLNSAGQTIWDNDKHKGFESTITAVGRDDASGLFQTKSSNMFEEGLLTIELNGKLNAIPDNYFVFWSDNGKNLLLKKQEQGEPIGIDRQWQLDYQSNENCTLNWTFDPKFIKATFPEDTFYWLLVDYSGKGTYSENNSEYIKLTSTSSKEKIQLNHFNWDKQKSGVTKFTLKVAPEMFSRVWITEAKCDVSNSGELHYSIVGGEAPYTVTVKNEGSSSVLKQWSQTAKGSNGVQLSSGNYEYTVRDAKGNLYSETIFVADKEGTFPKLKSDYLLTDGNSLLLDASLDLPNEIYEYKWLYEGNFIDNTAKITINQAGSYELRLVNTQGCKTSTKIEVASDGKNAMSVSNVLLYPNPTTGGHFSIAMQFPQKTNIAIRIYTLTGKIVKEQKFSQIENYIHNEVLDVAAGMYLLTVSSDFGDKTFKVIIK